MKPSSWDKQLGLASPLECAASQSGQTNNPSKSVVGLDVSHHTRIFPRGRGEAFFLDILFHRMSRDIKYIGMDIHKEAIVIAVLNGSGKLVMETVVETKASSILEFLHGLRGELHVTWEEGTWAAWLYDLLQPQVEQVVVCNPRRNALLKEGSKSDK